MKTQYRTLVSPNIGVTCIKVHNLCNQMHPETILFKHFIILSFCLFFFICRETLKCSHQYPIELKISRQQLDFISLVT